MSASRLQAERGESFEFEFCGKSVTAYRGETVAAALMSAGVEEFAVTANGEPRQPFCNMGTCFDCVVTVNGQRLVRSCLTDAEAGMCVEKHEAS